MVWEIVRDILTGIGALVVLLLVWALLTETHRAWEHRQWRIREEARLKPQRRRP